MVRALVDSRCSFDLPSAVLVTSFSSAVSPTRLSAPFSRERFEISAAVSSENTTSGVKTDSNSNTRAPMPVV